MRSFAAAVVLGTAAAGPLHAQSPSDTAARPISLSEAISRAQQSSPTTVTARGTVRTAQAQELVAKGAFIPSVTFSAGNVYTNGNRFDTQGNLVPYTGDPWQYSYGLSIAVDAFDGLRRIYDLRAARAAISAADANELEQRFQVALQVKQQYYAVLAAREEEAAADAQLAQALQSQTVANAKLKAGSATTSDSLREVIDVGNGRLAQLTAANDLVTANAGLTRLVATPYLVTASADDTLDREAPIDTASLLPLADAGPQVQSAAATATSAQAAAKSARSPYYPTLSLSYARSGNGSDPDFRLTAPEYTGSNQFRLGLSWSVFSQFTREQAVAVADVAQTEAEATLRDTRFQARQQLVQYLGALRLAREKVEIQRASVEAATEDLRVQRRRYEVGASTILDVLTSQTVLNQARQNLIQARFDYRVARAQLEALIGREL